MTFGYDTGDDLRAVALYTEVAPANALPFRVTAVRPNGSREEIIRFRPQPEWARRYWFEKPIALTARNARRESRQQPTHPCFHQVPYLSRLSRWIARRCDWTLDVVVGH